MIQLRAADASVVRRSLLVALASEGRASLFFLQCETGISEEELLRGALGLELDGLVTVEGRPDGKTSRRMVALTAAGRSRYAGEGADAEGRGAVGEEREEKRSAGGVRGCTAEGGACCDR